MASLQEPSISIRLVWPFARVAGSAELRAQIGRASTDFADRDTRIPRSVAMQILEQEAARLPTVGLRAAELTEPRDFDVLEYAARSAPTLGDAAHCIIRYFQLMDDAAEMSLDTEGDRATWRFRLKDGLEQPPSANDFAIATALAFSRRNTARYEPPIEVLVAHQKPSYWADYEEILHAPVRFGAPCNAIVIQRARLEIPMLRANSRIARTFEQHAERLLGKLRRSEGISGRIRKALLGQLPRGPVTMNAIARQQAMAVATLRRRLQEEGTTFATLLEDVRRDLAFEYLRDRSVTLTEVAFLLGYGNVTSFTRAFHRWTGDTPASHREREGRGPARAGRLPGAAPPKAVGRG